jgi:SOS-response transcriptional repressor LexA
VKDLFEQYKSKISDFCRDNRRVPGYQEFQKLTGFKSKNAVFKLIGKLVDEGMFEKDSKGKLSMQSLHGEIPMLGIVEAGIPTAAEAKSGIDSLDSTSVEEFLLGNVKGDTFMLEVKGDSMIDAHIAEGDMVLVERNENPKIGDIVVALVDGGWTLKYYRKDKAGQVYLQPANERFSDIYPEYELQVAAVVRAVIRKFK